METFYTYVLKVFDAWECLPIALNLFLTNACGLRVYWILVTDYSRDAQE